MVQEKEIMTMANEDLREFVGKFGHLLDTQWRPEDIIDAVRKDSKRHGYTYDDRNISDATLVDIDFKSLCVTLYDNNGMCAMSTWVEVWDNEGALLGNIFDGKFVNAN